MRDRRVCKQPLYIVLNQRANVAQSHRQRRRNPDEPEPSRSIDDKHDPQQYGERRRLGRGGHEANDGGGCTFVNVRRPNVKRCGSHFESETNEHQCHRHINQQLDRPGKQRPADVVNIS